MQKRRSFHGDSFLNEAELSTKNSLARKTQFPAHPFRKFHWPLLKLFRTRSFSFVVGGTRIASLLIADDSQPDESFPNAASLKTAGDIALWHPPFCITANLSQK
jgi:hypothetical protein